MKHPTQKHPFAVMLAALVAALAAFITTSQAQVTLQQVTNGLVSYYPLDQLVPGSTNSTPDVISRRDLSMFLGDSTHFMNGPAYLISSNVDSHPGMGDSTGVMNLSQSPSPTVMVYFGTGQNALTGVGDFLPFINQRGATMNFWIKGAVPGGTDQRVMAECAQNGNNVPFFSLRSQPGTKLSLGYFLRAVQTIPDPNGVTAFPMFDGTWELPLAGNGNTIWNQAASYCTNTLFDNNWHMLTTIIETNGDLHVFVDGNYDPGANTTTDFEGNPAMASSIFVTNVYYQTNIYPFSTPPTNNPPPNGFVRWIISGLDLAGAATAFGGFDRNNTIAGGPPIHLSDIGFWNRPLQTNEIRFVMTNGVSGLGFNSNAIIIVNFSADFKEVGQNHTVKLNWNVIGANSTPGGITITGVGDVSATPAGSTTVSVAKNSTYTFTLNAHNGQVVDKQATATVQTFAGVPSDWNLIQRFDGVFGNTTTGINGNGWVGLTGYYGGNLDRFNVVTVNGNKVLSPKSSYQVDTVGSPVGWDSLGALAYGNLNGLTIPPFQKNTLFFRFSVKEPTGIPYAGPPATTLYSGLDFVLGLTDFGFATGPIGGASPPGTGALGPGLRIQQYDSNNGYQPAAWNLVADNYDGTNVLNTYSYTADGVNGSASGLLTNVTYYCWLDVSNNNTMQSINGTVTNTINEPLYALWIQKQGDPSRTQLFANYGGDRSWANAGQNSDNPSPNLNKVFVSVATENLLNNDQGAFFATNDMILIDDFYLSTNGYSSTIPRLFNITSVVRNPTNAIVTWESLGSMLQLNTYSVQRTFSLNPAAWVTVTNGMPSGGDFTSFTDSSVGQKAFYRITWP
jgi:hypothetical protein